MGTPPSTATVASTAPSKADRRQPPQSHTCCLLSRGCGLGPRRAGLVRTPITTAERAPSSPLRPAVEQRHSQDADHDGHPDDHTHQKPDHVPLHVNHPRCARRVSPASVHWFVQRKPTHPADSPPCAAVPARRAVARPCPGRGAERPRPPASTGAQIRVVPGTLAASSGIRGISAPRRARCSRFGAYAVAPFSSLPRIKAGRAFRGEGSSIVPTPCPMTPLPRPRPGTPRGSRWSHHMRVPGVRPIGGLNPFPLWSRYRRPPATALPIRWRVAMPRLPLYAVAWHPPGADHEALGEIDHPVQWVSQHLTALQTPEHLKDAAAQPTYDAARHPIMGVQRRPLQVHSFPVKDDALPPARDSGGQPPIAAYADWPRQSQRSLVLPRPTLPRSLAARRAGILASNRPPMPGPASPLQPAGQTWRPARTRCPLRWCRPRRSHTCRC